MPTATARKDVGEPGIAGVTLSLLNSGGTVIATTVTDANGVYTFPGLPNGAYTVVVTDIGNVLAGLRQTQDPDQAGVCTTCNDQGTRTISGGATDNTVDFGYAPIGGTIGNQVWHDKDGDGLYEPKGNDGIAGTTDDESGMQGVTIDLYLDVNNNEPFDAGIDNLVRTTTTDINGQYPFTGLPAGKYLVDVAASNAAAGGVLARVQQDHRRDARRERQQPGRPVPGHADQRGRRGVEQHHGRLRL